MSALKQLQSYGQSPWLVYIQRSLVTGGGLPRPRSGAGETAGGCRRCGIDDARARCPWNRIRPSDG